jgi:hypothetical protein
MKDDNEFAARLGLDFSGSRGPTTIKEKKQSEIGHNSMAEIVAKARKGLGMVRDGEEKTIEGWLVYGAALNEGREMFPGDLEYGKWLRSSNLEDGLHPADMSAAMWAAANPQEFSETKKANPRVRTVRGLHAKWKDSQPTFSPAEWTDSERARKASIEAGNTALANKKLDHALLSWAEAEGHLVMIDRSSDWGNPYVVGQDGSREEVIDAYRSYLMGKKSLLKRLDAGELSGKLLVCHCCPEGCHGDVLKAYVSTPVEDDQEEKKGEKKARKLIVPDYEVSTTLGALKGMAEMFGKRYEGTPKEAASILVGEIIKGCEQDDIGMSIARDYVKWFLEFKEVLDLAQPDLEAFLEDKPNLKVVK